MSDRMNNLTITKGLTGTNLVKAFDEMMGGLGSAIVRGGFYFFEDGSYRELNILGPLVDAQDRIAIDDDGARKVSEDRLYYAGSKLEDAVKAFESEKADLAKRADHARRHGTQPPLRSELKHLRQLKSVCDNWESAYDAIDVVLNPPPVPVSQAENKYREVNSKLAKAFQKTLDSIEV